MPNNTQAAYWMAASSTLQQSIILPGITRCTPNKQKTRDHNSLANAQWSNKWSTLSNLHLSNKIERNERQEISIASPREGTV